MVQLVNFPSLGILYISVDKGRNGRVSRFRVARDATVIAAQGIIARIFDILDIVQITVGAGFLGEYEQHIVLLLQELHMLLYISPFLR